ncbi:MAG: hypothetical protein JWP81_3512 [Ferruginibacter sp.]|nr:hypothetical protein [Ferruginibacter sp.]
MGIDVIVSVKLRSATTQYDKNKNVVNLKKFLFLILKKKIFKIHFYLTLNYN